jgi:hypothetical protein
VVFRLPWPWRKFHDSGFFSRQSHCIPPLVAQEATAAGL